VPGAVLEGGGGTEMLDQASFPDSCCSIVGMSGCFGSGLASRDGCQGFVLCSDRDMFANFSSGGVSAYRLAYALTWSLDNVTKSSNCLVWLATTMGTRFNMMACNESTLPLGTGGGGGALDGIGGLSANPTQALALLSLPSNVPLIPVCCL
jgi:hypothetical protein